MSTSSECRRLMKEINRGMDLVNAELNYWYIMADQWHRDGERLVEFGAEVFFPNGSIYSGIGPNFYRRSHWQFGCEHQ